MAKSLTVNKKNLKKMASDAKRNYSKQIGKTFRDAKEAVKYLSSI